MGGGDGRRRRPGIGKGRGQRRWEGRREKKWKKIKDVIREGRRI